MKRTRTNRRATLVVSVLACLTLIMLLAGSWLRVVAMERRQLAAQHNRMQAEYVADAALARAAARLASDPAYDGETMHASGESLASAAGAAVTIRVRSIEGDPHARLVTVSAEFPAGSRDRAVRSIEQQIHLATKEPRP
jgi:Tfp pilus assembly protein PilX